MHQSSLHLALVEGMVDEDEDEDWEGMVDVDDFHKNLSFFRYAHICMVVVKV
jgi:hypothetical protein